MSFRRRYSRGYFHDVKSFRESFLKSESSYKKISTRIRVVSYVTIGYFRKEKSTYDHRRKDWKSKSIAILPHVAVIEYKRFEDRWLAFHRPAMTTTSKRLQISDVLTGMGLASNYKFENVADCNAYLESLRRDIHDVESWTEDERKRRYEPWKYKQWRDAKRGMYGTEEEMGHIVNPDFKEPCEEKNIDMALVGALELFAEVKQ